MDARVDPAAGVVVVSGASLPFTIDLRTGAALIVLGGERRTVRPLVWGETRVLSSYAHLGLPFLRSQLVAVALEGTPPADKAHEAAVWALAVWLNTAGGGRQALPADPVALAAATLDVCRALELTPAALDDRPTMEVEMLALALRERGERAERSPEPPAVPPAAGVTRIVVVPDPVPSPSAEDAGQSDREAAVEAPETSREEAPATEDVYAREPAGITCARPPSTSLRRRGFPTVRVFDPIPACDSAELGRPPAPPMETSQVREPRPSREPLEGRREGAHASPGRPSVERPSFRAAAHTLPSRAERPTSVTGGSDHSRLGRQAGAPEAPVARRSEHSESRAPHVPALSTPRLTGPEPSVLRVPDATPGPRVSLGPEDVESLVEELANRLEQAASEMGVFDPE